MGCADVKKELGYAKSIPQPGVHKRPGLDGNYMLHVFGSVFAQTAVRGDYYLLLRNAWRRLNSYKNSGAEPHVVLVVRHVVETVCT